MLFHALSICVLIILAGLINSFSFIETPLNAGDACLLSGNTKGSCQQRSNCHNSNIYQVRYCNFLTGLELICCPDQDDSSSIPLVCGVTSNVNGDSSSRFRRDVNYATEEESTTPLPFKHRIQFIYGGDDADEGKWPWIVAIRYENSSRYFCGGVLIDSQRILTAAHCIPNASSGKQLVCRIGDVNQWEYNVEEIVVHPGYKSGAYHDDLAVLKLAEAVIDPMPICLPQTSDINYDGQDVHVAGWGHTQFRGDPSEELQEIILPIFDKNECEKRYKRTRIYNRFFPGGFGNTKICAAENDGSKDACQGDSGGPMMRFIESKQIFELVGITSSGIGCGNNDYPGVYTRIDAYLNFISRWK